MIVSVTVPLEVIVTGSVEAVFRFTLPKERLEAPSEMAGTAAFNCSAKFAEALPALAVSVAVCAVPTAEMVAENGALVAPETIVTVAGTDTAELLLDRFTANPLPGAAPFRLTVQLSVPAPVMDALLHAIALSARAGKM